MSHTTTIRTQLTSLTHLKMALDSLKINYQVDGRFFTDGFDHYAEVLISVPKSLCKIAAIRKGDDLVFVSDWNGINSDLFIKRVTQQYSLEVVIDSMKTKGFVPQSNEINERGERVLVFIEGAGR